MSAISRPQPNPRERNARSLSVIIPSADVDLTQFFHKFLSYLSVSTRAVIGQFGRRTTVIHTSGGVTRIADRKKFCDRYRRQSQKIEPCSILCDCLRSSAINCDHAIIWKLKFCDLRSKRIP